MLRRSFYAFLFVVFAVETVRSQDTCKKVGPQCNQDGTKVWLCSEIGKPPVNEEACRENEKCREEKDQVACMEPSSAELRFKCSGRGEFPDPKDCSRTYICTEGNDTPTEVCQCPGGGFVFPEQGLPCVSDECPRKPISCSEGATGHFVLNNDQKTGYYYYCSGPDVVEVYEGLDVPAAKSLRMAFLRTMKNGKECKPLEGQTTTTKVSEPTPKPTTTAPEPTSKPPEQKPKCNSSGEFHKTECDCDFYECDKNLVPQRRNCRKGMLYNPNFKKCIYGDCDETKCIYRSK